MTTAIIGTILALVMIATAAAPSLSIAAMQTPPHAVHLTQISGSYRFELVMLPAEPYVTAADVRRRHLTEGMLVVRGARPVQPNDPAHPNHHLVVHVYDAATGHPVLGAKVEMSVVGPAPARRRVRVPIVEMQAVGGGAKSTHYGNNVALQPGHYTVFVTANGKATVAFAIRSI